MKGVSPSLVPFRSSLTVTPVLKRDEDRKNHASGMVAP